MTTLGGNFCQVVMVCPKCSQDANILGASLRDYQAALNYDHSSYQSAKERVG